MLRMMHRCSGRACRLAWWPRAISRSRTGAPAAPSRCRPRRAAGAGASASRTQCGADQGDANGHFQVEARVDGRRIDFLVDTGASHIALRESEAARLGIHPRPRDYTVRVSTANGVTKAALVQLRSVEVGDIIVRDVSAIVHPDEGLSVNLLGMSFLSRVRWTHERGKLVLEQ